MVLPALSLLIRLGLRGAETPDLQLNDVDWRAGEIAITGKGSRIERLPMATAARGRWPAGWPTAVRAASRGRCS